jgi:AcrR family transcriptional regulator
MKKQITKDRIIATTLALIQDQNDLQGLNLREIARALGCAHTNLYNHFPSYTGLLWETLSAVQTKFMAVLKENISGAKTAEMKLRSFFSTFLQVYLDNKGWFRLAWLEYIGDNRPQSNIETTKRTREELDRYAAGIWEGISGTVPDMKKISRVMHTTHCYIIGEISNYISGRRLIDNEAQFKKNTAREAMRLFLLCMRER